jgi:NACalpha-BTF3-like transcription factor
MDTTDWEDLREEVCTHLEIGMGIGETELETMTRLIWVERHNNLIAIEDAVVAALNRERGLLIKRKAKVLQWKTSCNPQVETARPKSAGLDTRKMPYTL